MSDTWLDQLNLTGSEEPWHESNSCDGCIGIATAADDEFYDHRCDLCKRPLSAASLWMEANRGHLSDEQVQAVTKVLFPDRSKVYRVHYWSVVLEQGLTSGLMTKKQAEWMAGQMSGKVIKEGE